MGGKMMKAAYEGMVAENLAYLKEPGAGNVSKRLEFMAEKQHAIWASWMKFMFECGELQDDGSWVMPKEKVGRWVRQMNTEYADLSEGERESDRKVVREFGIHKTPSDSLVLGAAVTWYEMGWISQERAAQITGLTRSEFIDALGEFDVSVFKASAQDVIKEALPEE